jgi:hypothetical protein
MHKLILAVLIAIILLNTGQLGLQIIKHQQRKSNFLGDQFKGLESIIKGQRIVGYYTDKNMDETLAIAQFEQAQYVLAPIVLDLNHTNYPFVIFDCTSPQVALNKITELKLRPVKASNTGIILTVNPNVPNLKP